MTSAVLQQSWHQGLGQTLSSWPLTVSKSALPSCWALLPKPHPGENLKDPHAASPCCVLPGSPQKEDPRPGTSRRVLCRAVNSPGAGKPSAWVCFQGYCSDYFPKAAEFLLPWAPGRTWPLGSRSALARAAPQHRTRVSAEPQRVFILISSRTGALTTHKWPLPSLPEA